MPGKGSGGGSHELTRGRARRRRDSGRLDPDHAASRPVLRSTRAFMLTILGITFLATLSSSSLSKGVLAGGIGLAISAVGIEDHTGTLRYTMGTIYLWEGLSLVPVVVGLFAIPEIVDLAHLRAGTSAHSFPGRVRIPWRLFGKQRFRGYRGWPVFSACWAISWSFSDGRGLRSCSASSWGALRRGTSGSRSAPTARAGFSIRP